MIFQNNCTKNILFGVFKYFTNFTSNLQTMEVLGYRKVTYTQLQKELQKSRADKPDLHEINLAANINVKSVGTIRNCFVEDAQVVSDEVLTKLFKELELDGIVLWSNGERNYLIKK